MRLFFRALLLAVAGLGSFGGGLLWAVSSTLNTTTDPQTIAVQTFTILAALLFGAFALLQAKEDYAAYRKANKKPNHALNAAVVLIAFLVLAFAGYKAWQGTQPITVHLTYLNGTTEQPIGGATLYLRENVWSGGPRPEVKPIQLDQDGTYTFRVPRDSFYAIFEKRPTDDVFGSSLAEIQPYDIPGSEYELTAYSGQTWYPEPRESDLFTIQVIDAQGRALADADVTAYTSATTQSKLQTDAEGQVQLQDNAFELPVFVAKEGYQSATAKATNGDLTLVMLTPTP